MEILAYWRRFNPFILVLSLFGVLLVVPSAKAATLVVDRTITGISSSTISAHGTTFEETVVTFDTSDINSLNLGLYNSIQFNILAPTAQKLLFNELASGFGSFDVGNGGADTAPAMSCAVNLLNLTGAAPSPTGGSCGAGMAGNFFFVELNFDVSAASAGTGLQFAFSFTQPPNQAPSNFSFTSPDPPLFLSFVGDVIPNPNGAPIPIVSLVPGGVPEPSSILLLGLGLLFMAAALRRSRAKRLYS